MEGSIVSSVEAGRTLPRLLTGLGNEGNEGAYYITDTQGRARAVLVDIDKYNAMMDALEDKEVIPDAKIASALIKAIIHRDTK
jgi:PHD/YefM family antitoxin component YafN of YafNO toxin-antitoxin module